MQTIRSVFLSIFATACLTGHAYAAGETGDLDITIRVIDSKQDINEFINRIELPKGVAEAVPATVTRTQEPGNGTAEKSQKPKDGDSGDDTRDDRGERWKNSDRERDGDDNGRPDQISAPAADRPWKSESARKDSSGDTDRPGESRERRENLKSYSREQRASAQEKSRRTGDNVRDPSFSPAWPDRPK